jgi:2-C-methyl-D-erythritol 4-phosphate cytidylyltransferase
MSVSGNVMLSVDEKKSKYYALIPAAGVGSRMQCAQPKQYLELAGKSVLQWTVEAFLQSPEIERVVVVVSPEDGYVTDALCTHLKLSVAFCGGASRHDSVRNGLDELQKQFSLTAHDWVLVHDAARPGLTPTLIRKLIDEVADDAVGGLLAMPVVDTVKCLDEQGLRTLNREHLWLAQTPQMFRFECLHRALHQVAQVTDEASAIEQMGWTAKLVEGHVRNLKLTRPDDLNLLAFYLGQNPN